MSDKAYLILADGTTFTGTACGAKGTSVGELIFDTGMSGYQEVLSDASFYGQIVMFTYPLIGNCGVNDEDCECENSYVRGLVVKELIDYPNNYRMTGKIGDYLKKQNIVAIEGVDTRAITRKLRDSGVMNAVITTEELTFADVKEKIAEFKIENAVLETSCKEIYKASGGELSVGLIDYGQKQSFIDALAERGASVTVYPADTDSETILKAGHAGIVLSNGAGNPADLTAQIETVKKLVESKIPMFGICLGHQLLALACGAKTYKLTYGHHGANHPVKDVLSGKTYICAQNHGYAVDEASLSGTDLEVSHTNLNDGTVEGLKAKNAPLFSVQFHPNGCPGPKETAFLFDEFVKMMGGNKNA